MSIHINANGHWCFLSALDSRINYFGGIYPSNVAKFHTQFQNVVWKTWAANCLNNYDLSPRNSLVSLFVNSFLLMKFFVCFCFMNAINFWWIGKWMHFIWLCVWRAVKPSQRQMKGSKIMNCGKRAVLPFWRVTLYLVWVIVSLFCLLCYYHYSGVLLLRLPLLPLQLNVRFSSKGIIRNFAHKTHKFKKYYYTLNSLENYWM